MKRELVDSGISGYDDLLNGGFFKKTVNVVSGESGTGKTVMGASFLYHGVMEGEKGLCIMTTERGDNFIEDIDSSFGWDFLELEKSGMISFIDISNPELRLEKTIKKDPTELIRTFKKKLSQKIEEIQPERVFIDSIEALFLAIESPYLIKTLVDDLFDMLRTENVTSLITIGSTFHIDPMIEYGADSVTRVGRVVSGNDLQRSIYVAKKRGSRTLNQIRVLNISDNGPSILDQSPYTSTI